MGKTKQSQKKNGTAQLQMSARPQLPILQATSMTRCQAHEHTHTQTRTHTQAARTLTIAHLCMY